MKIENKNINQSSMKSIKEFRKNQVELNIKIHIFALIMIFCIDICLTIFIISYIYKIKEISSKNTKSFSHIKENSSYLTSMGNSISHKMVNIFAKSFNSDGNIHFSFLFEKSEEVQSIKNKISTFALFSKPHLILRYESNIDGDNSSDIINSIKYWINLLFIIGSKSGEKFGFFFQETFTLNKKGFFQSNTNRCFLYSFMNKEEYPCNEIFILNNESLLDIGNGDIIINHEFKSNGGIINYPFKSFTIPENDNEFYKLKGKFEIKDIEIYIVYDLNFL